MGELPPPDRASPGPSPDGEHARIRSVFAGYAASRLKQRAWDAQNLGNAAMHEEFLERLHRLGGHDLGGAGVVLDIGCGKGRVLEALAARGISAERLHGVDLLQDNVESARAAVPGAQLQQADARFLPYPDRSVRVAMLVVLLSSLPTRAAVTGALREARRVLEPGGLLVCYDTRWPNPLNPHTRRVPRRDYEAALGVSSLTLAPMTVFPPLARRLGPLTPRIYPALAKLPPVLTHWFVSHRAAASEP